MPITVLGGTKVADTAFSVANSCRFNKADDPELSRSTGDGNEDILTNLLAKNESFIQDMQDMDIVNEIPPQIRKGRTSTGREGGTQTLGNGWFDKEFKKNLGIE